MCLSEHYLSPSLPVGVSISRCWVSVEALVSLGLTHQGNSVRNAVMHLETHLGWMEEQTRRSLGSTMESVVFGSKQSCSCIDGHPSLSGSGMQSSYLQDQSSLLGVWIISWHSQKTKVFFVWHWNLKFKGQQTLLSECMNRVIPSTVNGSADSWPFTHWACHSC